MCETGHKVGLYREQIFHFFIFHHTHFPFFRQTHVAKWSGNPGKRGADRKHSRSRHVLAQQHTDAPLGGEVCGLWAGSEVDNVIGRGGQVIWGQPNIFEFNRV